MQTLAELQIVHPVEHAAHLLPLKKYVETHVVHVFVAEHAAQFRGQQEPPTTVWVESHSLQKSLKYKYYTL